MKTNFFKYILLFLSIFSLIGCQEDDKTTFKTGDAVAPVFHNPEFSGLYELVRPTKDESGNDVHTDFKTFSWDAADMGFPTAIVYDLEVSANEKTTVVGTTSETSYKVNHKTLNDVLANVDADTLGSAAYTFSVKARVAKPDGNGVGESIISEQSFDAEIKPYPSHYKLFVVSATESQVTDKELFIISSNADHKYSGALELSKGAYHFYTNDFNDGTAVVYGVANDGSFVVGGEGVEVAEDGKYNISADLNTNTVGVAKAQPILWVPGAHNGWSHEIKDPVEGDITSYTNVNLVSADNNGVYTGKVWLTSEFKFTNQPNWDGTAYGSNGNKGQLDTDPGAGNHNVGDYDGIGLYELEVNINSNTFKVLSVEKLPIELPEGNALWVVGDHTAWGLNVDNVILETEEGSGIYTGILDLVGALDFRTTSDGVTVDKTYRSPEITEGQVVGSLVENGKYTIRLPKKDKYLVTVDLNAGTYELGEAINYIYKVGDVNGWNDPEKEDYYEIKIPEIYARGSKVYETKLTMKPGEGFKLVGVPGSWADSDGNWGFGHFPSLSSLIADDGGNFKYIGTEEAEYTITVDFNSNKMAFGERMFKVGSVNGWNDPSNSDRQRAEWVSDKVYKLETTLQPNEEFKLVGVLGSWDDGNHGWGDFSSTTGDLIKEGTNDDGSLNGNIEFYGDAEGKYILTFDLGAKTIEIESAE